MTYVPDPATWPAEEAEYLTRIRAAMDAPGSVLVVDELIRTILMEEGLGPGGVGDIWRADRDKGLRAAQIEYLVMEALHHLDRRGELWPAGGEYNGALTGQLLDAIGSSLGNQYAPNVRAAYRVTTHGSGIAAEWAEFRTMWTNVDRLADQVGQAWASGLDVAAAVTGRVAVEEAVARALEELSSDDDWKGLKAAQREARLFDLLTNPSVFTPLDREATKSALSAIRSLGNRAAHDGNVEHALLQDSLLRLLPQALVSLSRAVEQSSG